MKNESTVVGKVYKTFDLSQFNQIKGNRPPNPQHIRRLCSSIKEHGILQNPIIVNEKMDVIDGQHRLMAARKTFSAVYYIIVKGYDLNEVQILNLNQKNWTKKDFMEGYAEMGVVSYIKLREFCKKNNDFNLSNCISMCSNVSGSSNSSLSQKHRNDNRSYNMKEVFEEGTWTGKDFSLAQENANKIRLVGRIYENYNRNVFVGTMLSLFSKDAFDFEEFMHKLRLQPQSLVDCANREQTKMLIEDIYNYKRRDKVNLRF